MSIGLRAISKVFLIIILIFAFGILSILFLMQSSLAERFISVFIERQTKSSLNIDLSIGKLNIDLLQGKITFAGIKIPSFSQTDDKDEFLSISKLVIDMDLWALTNKKLLVSTISIDQPRVYMHIDPQGGKNFYTKTKAKKSTQPAKKSPPFPLLIQDIKIFDGNFKLLQENISHPVLLEFPEVEAVLRSDVTNDFFAYSGLLTSQKALLQINSGGKNEAGNNQSRAQILKLVANLECAALHLNREGINTEELRIKTESSTFYVAGKYQQNYLDLHIRSSLDIPELAQILFLPKALDLKGGLKLDTTMQGAHKDLTIAGSAEFQEASLGGSFAKKETKFDLLTLNATYRTKPETLDLENIKAQTQGGTLEGFWKAAFKSKPWSQEGKVKWENLNVNNLLETFSEIDLASRFVSYGESNFSGSGQDIDQIKAKGWVKISGDLNIPEKQKLEACKVKTNFVVNNGLMELNNLSYSLPKQNFNAKLTFSLAGQLGSSFQLDLTDLSELHYFLNPRLYVSKPDLIGISKEFRNYLSDLSGALNLKGTLDGKVDAIDLKITALGKDLAFKDVTLGSLNGNCKFDGSNISLTDLNLKGALGQAQGQAFFALKETKSQKKFSTDLTFDFLDSQSLLSLFDNENLKIQGEASGKIELAGSFNRPEGNVFLSINDGNLYGQPFSKIQAEAHLSSEKIEISPFAIALNPEEENLRLHASLDYNKNFQIETEYCEFDLSQIHPSLLQDLELSGKTVIDIAGKGSLEHPNLDLGMKFGKVIFMERSLGEAEGKISLHEKELKVNLSGFKGSYYLEGSMQTEGLFPYQLKLKCLDFTNSRILNTVFKKSLLEKFALDYQNFGGSADYVAELKGNIKEKPIENLNLLISNLSLSYLDKTFVQNGLVEATIDKDILNIEKLELFGPYSGLTASGGITLGDLKEINLEISGDANLDFISNSFRDLEIYQCAGQIKTAVNITGALKDPQISGILLLDNGFLEGPWLGKPLSNAKTEVVFNAHNATIHEISADVGAGRIFVKGNVEFQNFKPDFYNLEISGKNLSTRIPEGLKCVSNSQLSLIKDHVKTRLSGDIFIREAEYSKRIDWKSLILDYRQRQLSPATQSAFGDMELNLNLVAPDNVKVDTNILTLESSLDLEIKNTINNPMLFGSIELINGYFYAREGSKFKIVSGRIEFVDPYKLNPTFYIVGNTKIDIYNIDLILEGNLDRIQRHFSSDPSLSDVDIVSLLAAGRVTGDLAEGSSSGVATGELTSFVTGAVQDRIESEFQYLFGFDRFQVDPVIDESGTNATARITVGKHLSFKPYIKDLYVTYSSNIASSEEQTIRAEYPFTEYLALIGAREEDGSYGADLKIHFPFRRTPLDIIWDSVAKQFWQE